MSDLPPPNLFREPRPAAPVAHRLRQSRRKLGRLPGDAEFAEIARQCGVSEAEVRGVAVFFEEFDQAAPPEEEWIWEPNWPRHPQLSLLTAEARLSALDDDDSGAIVLATAIRRSPHPGRTVWSSLRGVEQLDQHRVKNGRTLMERWMDASDTIAAQRFIVCHANAGNPGASGGPWLLHHRPGAILAGMALAGMAVGASEGVICVDRRRRDTVEAVRSAIGKATAAGLLGGGFDVTVLPTFGSHVGGEETALLNAIEGRRGEARARPPEPERSGIYGLPTVIETAEIFALLPDWLRRGRDDGTRLIAKLPPFADPGLVEIDAGISLRRLVSDSGDLAAVALGGPFGSLVFPENWDTALSAEAFGTLDLRPGNWSVAPVAAGASFDDWAGARLDFAAAESCGKCAPCRLGPLAARDRIADGTAGKYRFREILDTMSAASLCGFGRDLPGPIRQWLKRWGAAEARMPEETE
jgi:NADH:ubiquinone oxidoreductase subunit F (NADH-binding)